MQPILAADASTYITLIFVILGFLGWIMNLTSNKNAPPPARPRQPDAGGRPPNRDERIQSEIDIFLQEVGGRKPKRPEPARERAVEQPAPPARRPVARRPVAEAPRTADPPRLEPPARPAHRVGSGELGTGVREHLARQIELDRAELATKQPLSTVAERISQHHLGSLGQKEAAPAATVPEVAAATLQAALPLHRLLRDPNGLRNAVLISEILGPPRGKAT
jgi:cell division protein FtsN